MLSARRGFTLIELLVVIGIMAITSVFTLANYRSFGEDQNLKNALLDVQNQLRAAQTNATTSVKCDTQYGASWMITFINITSLQLQCTENWSDIWSKKTFQPSTNPNISMQFEPSVNCPDTSRLFSIAFAPLTGKISFLDSAYREKTNCASIKIILHNSKTQSNKSLVIEQGSQIHEQ
ncbi:MAG: prepilin-type N-terminal cleavage/methylation domain-containing protein [Candidatus Daviesbacteria bacterium]|nr:prepilin-type N-terminal cleavage/methylation domain-containing protein [Candidatus Daviesbacteria bacterium]